MMIHRYIILITFFIISQSLAFAQEEFSASQLYAEAIQAINDNSVANDFKAIQHLNKSAEMSHASAARYLGLMYWFGKIVIKDIPTAQNWFYKADCLDCTTSKRPANKSFSYFYLRIFSTHNGSNTKDECIRKQQEISSKFSLLDTRLRHNAPYWHIDAGYFLTKEEAESVAKIIKKEFPQYNRTIKVIKDTKIYR